MLQTEQLRAFLLEFLKAVMNGRDQLQFMYCLSGVENIAKERCPDQFQHGAGFRDEDEPTKRQAVTKHSIVSRFKNALTDHNLASEHIRQRASLRTPGSHSAIDFALHNGQVVQMTQCWSFQVQNREQLLNDVKSWAWTIRDVRLMGGEIVGGGQSLQVQNNVPVAVVYAPPDEEGEEEWEEAVRVFDDNQVDARHVQMDDADEIAEMVANTLGTA